jgi:sortase (surface protein transpeptidase)
MTRRTTVVAALAGILAVAGTATGITVAVRSHQTPAVHAQATPGLHAPVAGTTPTPASTETATATPRLPGSYTAGTALARTLQPLDLHAPYSQVPLHVTAPSIQVDTIVLGVGLTKTNNVDAPEGSRDSPLWDDAFWYRGSAEPGQPGVFALAGHVDRVGGAAAAFAHLSSIKPGDIVTISDQRSGIDFHYRISEARSYSLKEVESLPVLERIYGPEPAHGNPPVVPADMVGRISVITCTGTWTGSQYDHRFVAFGELVDPLR